MRKCIKPFTHFSVFRGQNSRWTFHFRCYTGEQIAIKVKQGLSKVQANLTNTLLFVIVK
jgi:hypothetical protein